MMKPSRHGEMRSATRTRGKIRCIAIIVSGMYLPSARKKVLYNYIACVKPPWDSFCCFQFPWNLWAALGWDARDRLLENIYPCLEYQKNSVLFFSLLIRYI